jgi:hypothetical protein
VGGLETSVIRLWDDGNLLLWLQAFLADGSTAWELLGVVSNLGDGTASKYLVISNSFHSTYFPSEFERFFFNPLRTEVNCHQNQKIKKLGKC